MSKENKTLLVKYLIAIVVGLSVVYYYTKGKDVYNQDIVNVYRIIADGFSIVGLLYSCFGALLALSNTGILDGVVYGVMQAFRMLIPGIKSKTFEKYSDFVANRETKRVKGYLFILFTGLGFLLVSAVFIYLFYQVY